MATKVADGGLRDSIDLITRPKKRLGRRWRGATPGRSGFILEIVKRKLISGHHNNLLARLVKIKKT